jgi:hypothetical protein
MRPMMRVSRNPDEFPTWEVAMDFSLISFSDPGFAAKDRQMRGEFNKRLAALQRAKRMAPPVDVKLRPAPATDRKPTNGAIDHRFEAPVPADRRQQRRFSGRTKVHPAVRNVRV